MLKLLKINKKLHHIIRERQKTLLLLVDDIENNRNVLILPTKVKPSQCENCFVPQSSIRLRKSIPLRNSKSICALEDVSIYRNVSSQCIILLMRATSSSIYWPNNSTASSTIVERS